MLADMQQDEEYVWLRYDGSFEGGCRKAFEHIPVRSGSELVGE